MKKIGRPIKLREARRAQKLRAKGFSYRQIAMRMNEDLRQVYMWCHYDLS